MVRIRSLNDISMYALWFEFFGRLIDPNFCIIHYYCCFMSQYLFEISKHKQHVYGNAHFKTSQSNDNSNTKQFMFLLENEKRYWHLWDNEFVIQEMRMPLFIHIHRVLCILKPNHFRSFRVQTAYTHCVPYIHYNHFTSTEIKLAQSKISCAYHHAMLIRLTDKWQPFNKFMRIHLNRRFYRSCFHLRNSNVFAAAAANVKLILIQMTIACHILPWTFSELATEMRNSMSISSNECRSNLISNEMKTISAKLYALQWHLYLDYNLCLIMTSTHTHTRACTCVWVFGYANDEKW